MNCHGLSAVPHATSFNAAMSKFMEYFRFWFRIEHNFVFTCIVCNTLATHGSPLYYRKANLALVDLYANFREYLENICLGVLAFFQCGWFFRS